MIKLREHLEKLVEEYQKNHSFKELKAALSLLEGESQYHVRSDDNEMTVAELILGDLDRLGAIHDMEDYLNRSEEAREYDLWSLLSEYHPSSLD